MIRDMGISTITISGLLTGCLSSSILIANEFERQTALAVLCKPISRIHFILGKYFGIFAATTALIFCQGLILEIALAINKYANISNDITFTLSLVDYYCLLGIYFSLLQILILTAISLVLSMYLNTAANLIVCFVVFIFCHTFSYILPFNGLSLNFMNIIISICYIILPNLQNLNMVAISDIANSSAFSFLEGTILTYIVYNSIYCIIYSIVIIWLAVFLFKRKEIV